MIWGENPPFSGNTHIFPCFHETSSTSCLVISIHSSKSFPRRFTSTEISLRRQSWNPGWFLFPQMQDNNKAYIKLLLSVPRHIWGNYQKNIIYIVICINMNILKYIYYILAKLLLYTIILWCHPFLCVPAPRKKKHHLDVFVQANATGLDLRSLENFLEIFVLRDLFTPGSLHYPPGN